MPRRAPEPDARQRDADRSRQRLLGAALEEFAAKGYAGARVHQIADRAGVNNQLVAYYFGGKAGLYRALQELWAARDAEIAAPELPLAELIDRYLADALDDPRMMRLMLWRGLGGDTGQPDADLLSETELRGIIRRQAAGELDPELDPATVLLALIAIVAAPIALPQLTRSLFGLAPDDPRFHRRYRAEVARLLDRLRP